MNPDNLDDEQINNTLLDLSVKEEVEEHKADYGEQIAAEQKEEKEEEKEIKEEEKEYIPEDKKKIEEEEAHEDALLGETKEKWTIIKSLNSIFNFFGRFIHDILKSGAEPFE